MDKKLIRQINALQPDQFNAQPGRVHGLIVLFEGKNAASKTAGYSDLGNIIVRRNGRQLVNATYKSLSEITDIRMGTNLFSSTVAANFVASLFIPFYISDVFDNALEILDENELNIEHQPGNVAEFDNLKVSIFAELSAVRETYEYSILRDNITEAGAVAGKPYQMNTNNLTQIYFGDSGSIVDLIQVDSDRAGSSRSVITAQSWNALKVSTLKDNKIEDQASIDYTAVKLYTEGNANSLANRNTEVTLTTSGSGTVEVVKCSYRQTV